MCIRDRIRADRGRGQQHEENESENLAGNGFHLFAGEQSTTGGTAQTGTAMSISLPRLKLAFAQICLVYEMVFRISQRLAARKEFACHLQAHVLSKIATHCKPLDAWQLLHVSQARGVPVRTKLITTTFRNR